MQDLGDGYAMEYSSYYKNFPLSTNEKTDLIKIPQMVTLDPEGMANKLHLSLQAIKGKTDFELMVDQDAFDRRINKGILPTVTIEDHIFYVDLKMDMLRPKDDFTSKGIVFSSIENYYDMDERTYTIPYNPKTHEFEKLDLANIKEIPKNIVAVSFPSERILDRIGWNKKFGFDPIHGLKLAGLTMHYKAKNVPWDKTPLPDIIHSNLEMEKRKLEKEIHPTQENAQQKSRGRKL